MHVELKRTPIDLLHFVSMEHEQFLVSLAENRDELRIVSRIQGLYNAAMSEIAVSENDVVVFQLLAFTHYHFLLATASMMRCHLSEGFASVRAAIDGALIGAQIIHDRSSQIAYAKREKPFDNFARYLGNLIKEGKQPPHPLVPTLFSQHKLISTFASHADVGSFVHRVNISNGPSSKMLHFEYFQFAQNETERKIHALTLFHSFVMILDVFSDFLVVEQKAVPKAWVDSLHDLGQAMERQHTQLKNSLRVREEAAEQAT
jgi:hypothetical protein